MLLIFKKPKCLLCKRRMIKGKPKGYWSCTCGTTDIHFASWKDMWSLRILHDGKTMYKCYNLQPDNRWEIDINYDYLISQDGQLDLTDEEGLWDLIKTCCILSR